MTWVRADTSLRNDDHIEELAAELGVDPNVALGLYVRLTMELVERDHLGFLPDLSDSTLIRLAKWRGNSRTSTKFVESLRKFWKDEQNFLFGYREAQGKLFEKRKDERERKRLQRQQIKDEHAKEQAEVSAGRPVDVPQDGERTEAPTDVTVRDVTNATEERKAEGPIGVRSPNDALARAVAPAPRKSTQPRSIDQLIEVVRGGIVSISDDAEDARALFDIDLTAMLDPRLRWAPNAEAFTLEALHHCEKLSESHGWHAVAQGLCDVVNKVRTDTLAKYPRDANTVRVFIKAAGNEAGRRAGKL